MPDQLPDSAKKFVENLSEKLKTKSISEVIQENIKKSGADVIVIGAGRMARSLHALNWPDVDRPTQNLGIEFAALEKRIEELENFLILD